MEEMFFMCWKGLVAHGTSKSLIPKIQPANSCICANEFLLANLCRINIMIPRYNVLL